MKKLVCVLVFGLSFVVLADSPSLSLEKEVFSGIKGSEPCITKLSGSKLILVYVEKTDDSTLIKCKVSDVRDKPDWKNPNEGEVIETLPLDSNIKNLKVNVEGIDIVISYMNTINGGIYAKKGEIIADGDIQWGVLSHVDSVPVGSTYDFLLLKTEENIVNALAIISENTGNGYCRLRTLFKEVDWWTFNNWNTPLYNELVEHAWGLAPISAARIGSRDFFLVYQSETIDQNILGSLIVDNNNIRLCNKGMVPLGDGLVKCYKSLFSPNLGSIFFIKLTGNFELEYRLGKLNNMDISWQTVVNDQSDLNESCFSSFDGCHLKDNQVMLVYSKDQEASNDIYTTVLNIKEASQDTTNI